MSQAFDDTRQHARAVRDGSAELPRGRDAIKALIAPLKARQDFGSVRRILERVRERDGDADRWVVQQLALATYKDDEQVPGLRFAAALALLDAIGLRDPALADRETLGLGGAVYKRMWEQGGQLEHLHTALAFYGAGWERGDPSHDPDGRLYNAVNAAFIMDVLGSRARVIARRSGTPETAAARWHAQARELREQALLLAEAQVAAQPGNYWALVTHAELLYGLGSWDAAGSSLARAAELEPPDAWTVQSTARQLMALARALPAVDAPPGEGVPPEAWPAPWRAIARLFGPHARFAVDAYRGKVGLALSGGGFRASLFHLGVLARLAEMDVLRSVEVLSTVSGGSIVGAHYVLELQKLLESKADGEIGRDDLVALVRRLQRDFCDGVAKNMRMRTLTSLAANLRMAFSSRYTRSNRLGELYERHFYARVADRHQGRPREMRDLLVEPAGEARPFKPRVHNWRRRAKVPILLLNATSLNSGHNWQFTGRWMGEPPETFDAGVDMNERYRRLWYEQAPEDALRRWRLGDAVAASACVPGLFEPLVLEGLYPGRTVRLVDGGVHDNQGVEALIGEGCTLVLCSDASGQMADLRRPPDNRLGVPLRANSILMDRVREAQYQDLRARVDSRSLQGLFFVHMKQGLDVAPLDWTGCDDPSAVPMQSVATTAHGIDKTLQRQLAAIRTDLDAFSELECELLMLSGYLMSEQQFRVLQQQHRKAGEAGTWGGYDVHAPRGEWSFLRLEALARLPPDASDARRQEIERQIEASGKLFFRVWFLSPALRGIAIAAALAAVALAIGWLARNWGATYELRWTSARVGQVALGAVLLAAAFVWPLLKWLQPASAMRGVLYKLGAAFGGWAAGWVHLKLFDPLFLRIGRVQRLLRLR